VKPQTTKDVPELLQGYIASATVGAAMQLGLFRKIHDALHRDGHLVVVDKSAPSQTDAPPSRLSGAFLASLQHAAQPISFTTLDMVQSQLQQKRFRAFVVTSVPQKDYPP
jgi:hypothetical protein